MGPGEGPGLNRLQRIEVNGVGVLVAGGEREGVERRDRRTEFESARPHAVEVEVGVDLPPVGEHGHGRDLDQVKDHVVEDVGAEL